MLSIPGECREKSGRVSGWTSNLKRQTSGWRTTRRILLISLQLHLCSVKHMLAHPTGCVYDFPTSSEGKLPNIVDAQKKRRYTPLEIETVIHSKRGACHGSSILRRPSQSPTLDDSASSLDPRTIGPGHRDVKDLCRVTGNTESWVYQVKMMRFCVGSGLVAVVALLTKVPG